MPRSKKKPGKKTARPTKKAAKKKAPRKKAAKKAAPKRKPKAKGPDVQKTWREYLQHRTALEQAVAAVRAAEETLTRAREAEASRREVFNNAKSALEGLLEVAPATGAPSEGQGNLLDFSRVLAQRDPGSGDSGEVGTDG